MCHPFTSYCLYTAGCRKWQTTGCADCPQLGVAASGKDECREIFDKRREAFAAPSWTPVVVTPSRWLRDEIGQSLLGKRLSRISIPTSVELALFAPSGQAAARRALGLPEDRDILLIGSAGLRRNKGFQVLARALSLLAGRWKKPPLLLTFGYAPEDTSLLEAAGIPWKALGWVGDPAQLALAYSAADVFVSPSFQDNLPNTANEALACGTPVVCFDRYSSEEVVIDGVTGLTARHPGLPLSPEGELLQQEPYAPAPEACADLADKILSLLSLSEDERRTLRANCRTFAERAFSPALQAARYLRTYRKLLGLAAVAVPGLEEDGADPAAGLTKLDL
ncbi:MAG: glycosyltransferase [Desulfovibrio sp.]|nr:glycosyltransferase [Desulfovibrio sp.]